MGEPNFGQEYSQGNCSPDKPISYGPLFAWPPKAKALVIGHTGFDRIVTGEETSVDRSFDAHYLHHKYFEVNYADSMVRLDKWFGAFHDGTPEAREKMKERRRRRGT